MKMIFGLLIASFIFSVQAFDPCSPVGLLKPDENSPGFFQCTNWGWQPMPCPEGLCFNPKISVCDWPLPEKRCGNHTDVIPCKTVGELKPDPEDCHNFLQCSNSGWVKQHCPGDLYFNPDISVCDWAGPKDTCGGHHNDDDNNLEPCSKIGEIKADTKHCDLYYECTACGWSLIQCEAGQLFNPKKRTCDKPGNVKCAHDGDLEPCDKIGEFKEDPKHCDLYYECTDCGWALVNCEVGLYFNTKTSTCDKPENVKCSSEDDNSKLQPCDKIGELKPDSDHCDQYFKCTKKGWGALPCEAGTLFNSKTLKCEAADLVKCGGNDDDDHDDDHHGDDDHYDDNDSTQAPLEPCEHVGDLKPDPINRNKFYQCTPYGWQIMPCYGTLVFNPTKNQCDYPEDYESTSQA